MIAFFSRLRRRGDRGSSAAFVAIIALPLFLLFGLVLDGGRALNGRVQAKSAAAEAARAVANDCNPAVLRQDRPAGGYCRITDQQQAIQDAIDYLQTNQPGAELVGAPEYDVIAGPNGSIATKVTVRVRYRVQTTFLGAIGVRTITVESAQSAFVYTSA